MPNEDLCTATEGNMWYPLSLTLEVRPMKRWLSLALPCWGIFAICTAYLLPTYAQTPASTPTKPEVKSEEPKDALGRDTPRGTVLGFLAAARKDISVAALYLDTPLRGPDAEELAQQLAV